MPRKLDIKMVTPENFEAFVDLIRQFAKYVKLDEPDDEAVERLRRDALSENPKFKAFLGVKEGAIVGYVFLYMTYSSFLALPTLFIEDLLILEKYRRMGFGQQLFDFCVQQAKENDCARMWWIVPSRDKAAIRFYTKNKAKRLDRYPYQMILKTSA